MNENGTLDILEEKAITYRKKKIYDISNSTATSPKNHPQDLRLTLKQFGTELH